MAALRRFALALAVSLACVAAQGYIVGPAADLDRMAGEADLIIKGTAGEGATM